MVAHVDCMRSRSEAIWEAFKLAVRLSSWEVILKTKFLLLIQTAIDNTAKGTREVSSMTAPSCSRMPIRILGLRLGDLRWGESEVK